MASVARSALRTALAARACARPSASVFASAPRFSGARFASSSAVRSAETRPGPALTATNRAETQLRRFWKYVHVKDAEEGGFHITLDQRNLKTPSGSKLIIPRERQLLALLIAAEWENQDQVLKQHALPLTSLASRAIDGLADPATREGVTEQMLKYLSTDTICYPDDHPAALVRLQHQYWDPLYKWLKDDFGVTLNMAVGFSAAEQSPQTIAAMRAELDTLDVWELAAFERAAYATKSFVIALALIKGRLTAEQAALASHAEVASQIERWGEVEDTHDVDYQDIRRALGSAACMINKGQ